MASGMNGFLYDMEESNLSRIDYEGPEPFQLFREWLQDARKALAFPDALCLCTQSRSGEVSARTVILRRLEEDGFVFMTDSRSKKSQDLLDVPKAFLTFFWGYKNNSDEVISRQVKVMGAVRQLEPHQYSDLYDREPLFCKLRSHICHQGQPVDWQDHKASHDALRDQVRRGVKKLPMPDHVVAYKLIPDAVEFYFAKANSIGDRLSFKKVDGMWTVRRLMA
ncbi:pyridoxine/pyridoxamine 5'-phosphate oxidase-like [Bacillus rossius redtenbacheri]|uniref:pyridoxine/pyridoxamine 5'-phosphate oxidase-like n=1 Tax=Bacillus rossius redtenbacheri TaxID=93214 RepID=UPI002FDE14CB